MRKITVSVLLIVFAVASAAFAQQGGWTEDTAGGKTTTPHKVGIGTTTAPLAKLEVYDTGTVNEQLVLRNNGTYHTGFAATSTAGHLGDSRAWGMFGGPNTYMTGLAYRVALVLPIDVPDFSIVTGAPYLNAFGTPRFTVTQAGKVGIGTANPDSLLHLRNDVNTGNPLRFTNTGVSPAKTWHFGGVGNDFAISETGVNNSLILRNGGGVVVPSGFLGIGVGTAGVPTASVDVYASPGSPALKLRGYWLYNGGGLTESDGTSILNYYSGPNNRQIMFVDSTQQTSNTIPGIRFLLGQTHASIGAATPNGAVEKALILNPSGGNVGIGLITVPVEALHVAGNIRVDGNINAKFQDVAEWVPATEPAPAGTVVVVAPRNHVSPSTDAYDTRVAGVVSAQPGIVLGEAGDSKVLVATTGRVKVRVDASNGAIREGDILVSSSIKGVAMKSEPLVLNGRKFHQPGTVIGKALEPLEKGTGEILVLLSMQ